MAGFFEDDDKVDLTPVLADAHNRPEGWGTYTGQNGETIDVRRGVDPAKLKSQIQGIYGDLYTEGDFEGRLKNIGYDTPSYGISGALAAAQENVAARRRELAQHGGADEPSRGPMRMGAFPYKPFPESFHPTLGAFPSDIMDKFTGTFTAPDPNGLLTNPVIKARLAARRQAIESSAAARGTLLNPSTLDALADDASAELSSEYSNIYDRARSEFLDAYNIFTGDRTRRASTYGAQTGLDLNVRGQDYMIARSNQLDPFNMGLQLRDSARGDRSLDLQERGLGETLTMGAYNRGRFDKLDDYEMWRNAEKDYYDRLDRGMTAGRPR